MRISDWSSDVCSSDLLFAVSRIDAASGQEILLAFNTSNAPLSANVAVDPLKNSYIALYGDCPAASAAPGQLAITLPPLGYMNCKARSTNSLPCPPPVNLRSPGGRAQRSIRSLRSASPIRQLEKATWREKAVQYV